MPVRGCHTKGKKYGSADQRARKVDSRAHRGRSVAAGADVGRRFCAALDAGGYSSQTKAVALNAGGKSLISLCAIARLDFFQLEIAISINSRFRAPNPLSGGAGPHRDAGSICGGLSAISLMRANSVSIHVSGSSATDFRSRSCHHADMSAKSCFSNRCSTIENEPPG